MTVIPYALGAIALVVSVVWSVRNESRTKEKKVQEAFAGRDPLTPEAFYDRYFLGLGIATDVVIGIRQILEERLGADMSRLQAEDDFSKNLNFFWDFDSMADVEIVVAIEEFFHIELADSETQNVQTVSELVHLVSAKVGRPCAPKQQGV